MVIDMNTVGESSSILRISITEPGPWNEVFCLCLWRLQVWETGQAVMLVVVRPQEALGGGGGGGSGADALTVWLSDSLPPSSA